MEQKAKNKRIIEGVVVSDKMDKTIVIAVTTLKQHKIYKKFHKETKKYKAHDEKNQFKVGDIVKIQETRPISKDKKWTVVGN